MGCNSIVLTKESIKGNLCIEHTKIGIFKFTRNRMAKGAANQFPIRRNYDFNPVKQVLDPDFTQKLEKRKVDTLLVQKNKLHLIVKPLQ